MLITFALFIEVPLLNLSIRSCSWKCGGSNMNFNSHKQVKIGLKKVLRWDWGWITLLEEFPMFFHSVSIQTPDIGISQFVCCSSISCFLILKLHGKKNHFMNLLSWISYALERNQCIIWTILNSPSEFIPHGAKKTRTYALSVGKKNVVIETHYNMKSTFLFSPHCSFYIVLWNWIIACFVYFILVFLYL